ASPFNLTETKIVPLKAESYPNIENVKQAQIVIQDGKPVVIAKDNQGVNILPVNIQMVNDLLGNIKPETAKIVSEGGEQKLVFTSADNQVKSVSLDKVIDLPKLITQPQVIVQDGKPA